MHELFESAEILWLLAALPLVAGVLLAAHYHRQRAARRFADQPMLPRLAPRPRTWRVAMKGLALLAAIACLIVAAARPRWGEGLEVVQSRGVDLFVLLDISKSMLAEDVAPNRLERAKADIRDLLEKLPGDRVGLIVFAGAAIVRAPLTTDHAFVSSVLDEIRVEAAPRGGTQLGDALMKGLEAMPPYAGRDQVLVVITDGEDHGSLPREAASAAADRGVKVIAVGLGDPNEGSRVPLRDDRGRLQYLRHEGQEVWSRLDEALLKDLALQTGGAYVPARTRSYDLGRVYEEHLADLTRGELQTTQRRRYRDQYQWFLAAGLVLLLVEGVTSRTRPAS